MPSTSVLDFRPQSQELSDLRCLWTTQRVALLQPQIRDRDRDRRGSGRVISTPGVLTGETQTPRGGGHVGTMQRWALQPPPRNSPDANRHLSPEEAGPC